MQTHNYLHYVKCCEYYCLRTPLSGIVAHGNKDKTAAQSRLSGQQGKGVFAVWGEQKIASEIGG